MIGLFSTEEIPGGISSVDMGMEALGTTTPLMRSVTFLFLGSLVRTFTDVLN